MHKHVLQGNKQILLPSMKKFEKICNPMISEIKQNTITDGFRAKTSKPMNPGTFKLSNFCQFTFLINQQNALIFSTVYVSWQNYFICLERPMQSNIRSHFFVQSSRMDLVCSPNLYYYYINLLFLMVPCTVYALDFLKRCSSMFRPW